MRHDTRTNRLSDKKSARGARKTQARRLAEVSQLEQRVLCSATPHLAVPWLSPTHTGITVHTHRTVGVSGRPPTVSGKPAPTTTTLAAPSGLTASLAAATSAQLNWADNGTATGYYVLRSIDGGGFSRLANLASSTATSYADGSVSTGHTYSYEVQAYSGKQTSSVSNIASVSVPPPAPTPPAAPASLSATPTGSWVSLGWTESDASATGFLVLRSTDGATYAQIANVTSTSDLDSAVTAGQGYYYEVEAYNSAGLISSVSNVVSITAPTSTGGNGVSIGYRYGNELVVTAAGANDSISVAQSGSTLTITADGAASSYAVPTAGLFIYTRGGSDGVAIAGSVTGPATVMSIDGAATSINSSGANVQVWMDSTDSFSGTGVLHKVASFAAGVSKGLGASMANPTDAGATVAVNLSLFGTGPVADDVNQGYVADCYFLSSLAGFAKEKPSVLLGSAVDMGDGTYTVQFMNGTTPTFVRVSNALSTGGFGGYAFAHPGADNTIWAMIMEKAFCYFRSGANTYSSIGSGWMGEVYSDLGVSNSNFIPSSYSESAFYNMVSGDLAKGETVTLGTGSAAPNLVSAHGYTLISASIDSNGVTHYVVRNPWGFSGDGLEDGMGYATLTFAQMTANFFEGVQALG